GRTVAVLGLTFKAGTDDMRGAASLELIPDLQRRGATARAYEPKGMEAARDLLPGVTVGRDAFEAGRGASAVVILTEGPEFRAPDLARLAEEGATPPADRPAQPVRAGERAPRGMGLRLHRPPCGRGAGGDGRRPSGGR